MMSDVEEREDLKDRLPRLLNSVILETLLAGCNDVRCRRTERISRTDLHNG